MEDEGKHGGDIVSRGSRPSFQTYSGYTLDSTMAEYLDHTKIMSARRNERFLKLFRRFLAQRERREGFHWDKVRPPSDPKVVDYEALERCPSDHVLTHELLQKLVILKLNGGLGRSMGCKGPKSAIEVRSGQTFLDLTVKQVEYLNSKYGVDVPLVLMNSFSTHEETLRLLAKYRDHNLKIHTFTQNCYPVLLKETLMPMASEPFGTSPESHWHPPGHGDVFDSLFQSGLLENLVNQNKEYVFISNIDNLGATADLHILFHIINAECEFAMEVTPKTRADVRGGTLVEYDGKPVLLELPQVPKDHIHDFASMHKFSDFNTNNLWVNLRAIQRLVATDALDLAVFSSAQSVDGKNALQLETAAGAAIHCFNNGLGIRVPRARFLPVKSTSDLFVVQSDLFTVKHGSVQLNPARSFPHLPLVKLGGEFRTLEEFERRLRGRVEMLELDHLTVAGDVTFGDGVVLKGTVIIVANEGSRIDIPAGAVLENKVVTGHLRIMEH